jgi:D-alanyl-lipoteichoic acid acyltransferase DltB (MBOAT superfamily)
MLFQSQFYILVFLPLTVAIYYATAQWTGVRQWILVVASLLFYAWWDPRFVVLVVAQIVATWLLARLHERTGWRGWLVLAVVLNLASLATFKYLDFLLGAVESATGLTLPRANLILPIGISFFSFQLISYIVDRARGDAPIYPLRPFALFVLFFPHVIAGPIVRHNELVPQFDENPLRAGLWTRIGTGLAIFTVGLAKKVFLADRLAPLVDELFNKSAGGVLGFGEAWTAALGFSLQLFLDFSAYTEMAIGSALLFALVLPENFNRPYLAVSLRDFWRRWHISLSKFLRDYLYIPLGGSRGGVPRYIFATLATMGICGLWHGAGWTYVAWGLWHGAGLIVCRGWQSLGRPLPRPVAWLLTMAFVLVGWVIFRARDFSSAGSILSSLAGGAGWSGGLIEWNLLALAALASLLIPSAHDLRQRLRNPVGIVTIALALLAIACIFEVGKGTPLAFIYFQF